MSPPSRAPSRVASGAAVLAVDGGNSKTDVALVARDGSVLAAVRGPTSSHQQVGIDAGMATLRSLVYRAASKGGLPGPGSPAAELGVYGLAGADFPSDVRLLRGALAAEAFAAVDLVLNDTFAALRAGTRQPWGVALICGQGVNACAVAPDGRSARFDGVGEASGDWGGGGALGSAAVAAAVRGRDGRGPRTSLERLVPTHFGLRSPVALTKALYFERISDRRLSELAPVVFAAAADGDAVARAIVDRLADGIHAAAPKARLVRLEAPPVLGAALLGLDRQARGGVTSSAVETRLRDGLEHWRPD